MSMGRVRFVAVMAATLTLVLVSDIYAQPQRGGQGRGGAQGRGGQGRGGQPGGRGFGGQGFQGFGQRGGGAFGGFGGSSPLEIALRSDVQKELEILDDQVAELEKLREGQRDRMAQLFQRIGGRGGRGGAAAGGDQEDRRAQMRELLATANRELKGQVEGILLPHQSKRLDQLVVQYQMRGGGIAGVFRNDEVTDKLGITEAQQDEATQKAESIEADLQKKIAALRKEAQDKLMGQVLNSTQQTELKELVGDPFEFEDTRRTGGGRTGRGGRGGGQ